MGRILIQFSGAESDLKIGTVSDLRIRTSLVVSFWHFASGGDEFGSTLEVGM